MLRLEIPYLPADAFSVVRRKHRVAGFAPGLAGIGKASGIEKKDSVLYFQKGPVGVAEERALQIPGAPLIHNTGKIHGYSVVMSVCDQDPCSGNGDLFFSGKV